MHWHAPNRPAGLKGGYSGRLFRWQRHEQCGADVNPNVAGPAVTHAHDHRLNKPGEALGWTLWLYAANYDYTRHLTRRGWAWEFLRRNKHYVVDWSFTQSEITALRGQGGPETLRLGAGASRLQPWGLIFRRRTGQKRQRR